MTTIILLMVLGTPDAMPDALPDAAVVEVPVTVVIESTKTEGILKSPGDGWELLDGCRSCGPIWVPKGPQSKAQEPTTDSFQARRKLFRRKR